MSKNELRTKLASLRDGSKVLLMSMGDTSKLKGVHFSVTTASAPAAKQNPARRFSDPFTMEDVDAYLQRRQHTSEISEGRGVSNAKSESKEVGEIRIPVKPQPQKNIAAATIADILGFNPVEVPTFSKLQEQDVPRKWKKYYSKLVDMREHHSKNIEHLGVGEIDPTAIGQDIADVGSESFERDLSYNLISGEKELVAEIDAAIERIRNGTYGICEVTGREIPSDRLDSIPFTRCTKEGQEIKDREKKKSKSDGRGNYFGDMSLDQSPVQDDSES